MTRLIEGDLVASTAGITIVVARFNELIVDSLLNGALTTLKRQGVQDKHITVVKVPGAFEIPLAAQLAAEQSDCAAVITLGAVIRGGTPHFDYVCSETTRGIGEVSLNENLPVAFGLLTTDNLQQSLDRSGDNHENKGEEAALTILELLTVFKQIQGAE